jgi:hypothetical protein
MDSVLTIFTSIFDPIRRFWRKESTHRIVSWMLVLIFLLVLVAQSFLPEFSAVFRNS